MFIFTVVSSLLFRLSIRSVRFLASVKSKYFAKMILKVSLLLIGVFVAAALSGEFSSQSSKCNVSRGSPAVLKKRFLNESTLAFE